MSHAIEAIRGSLVAKVFGICFVAIHLPLLALMLYLGLGRPSDPLPIIGVAVIATVLGSALASYAVYQFVSPIDRLAKAVERYHLEGIEPDLDLRGADGVRRLSDRVLALIQAQELTFRSLKRQANSDPLTGLGNRRWLQNAVAVEISRAARLDLWIWVIVFDLDHFKAINDAHGHAAGDEVLMIVAEATQQQVRPYDLIARIGGEEFCVVMVETSPTFGLKAAERIRSAIEAWNPVLDGTRVTFTASFGVHRGDPKTESFSDMIHQADAQLYKAKARGRNRVVGGPDDTTI